MVEAEAKLLVQIGATGTVQGATGTAFMLFKVAKSKRHCDNDAFEGKEMARHQSSGNGKGYRNVRH